MTHCLVCRDLEKLNLEPFEVAQLANLCPEDVEEARALIPSLGMADRRGGAVDFVQLADALQQIEAYGK